jgi:uncharacterized protein
VTAFLLDASVLIALSWPSHSAHEIAQRWFKQNAQHGWATCPFTQCAFVRIISNPAFSPNALFLSQAIELLRANLDHPKHEFWPDDEEFVDLIRGFEDRLTGHQQVTDAYLLGLAIRRKGRLATLDRKVLALLPTNTSRNGAVELIAGAS